MGSLGYRCQSNFHIPLLADELGLAQIGSGVYHTANGLSSVLTYAVDIRFLGTTLSPRTDLIVGSCSLPFSLLGDEGDPRNMGMLIGRDVMAQWHLSWDGPTSTFFITD